jgi:hypothetical protein
MGLLSSVIGRLNSTMTFFRRRRPGFPRHSRTSKWAHPSPHGMFRRRCVCFVRRFRAGLRGLIRRCGVDNNPCADNDLLLGAGNSKRRSGASHPRSRDSRFRHGSVFYAPVSTYVVDQRPDSLRGTAQRPFPTGISDVPNSRIPLTSFDCAGHGTAEPALPNRRRSGRSIS